MKAKICFNNEIHRVSKLPEKFEALAHLINSSFHTQLPQAWALYYVDSDGDKIVLGDEHDYKEFVRFGSQDPKTVTKIFVQPVEVKEERKIEPLLDVIPDILEEEVKVVTQEEKKIESPSKPEENLSIKQEEKVEVEESKVTQEVQVAQEDFTEKVAKEKFPEFVQPDYSIDLKLNENMEESKILDMSQMSESKMLMNMTDLEKLVTSMVEKSVTNLVKLPKPEENQADTFRNKTIHYGVGCNGCGMMPIVGIRYSCVFCPGFDYCENCEETIPHSHNFIKMRQRDLLDIFRPGPFNHPNKWISVPQVVEEEPKEVVNIEENVNQWPSLEVSVPKKNNLSKRQGKKYFKTLNEKAKKLHKCFPKVEFDMLLAYVNEAPEELTLEELVENFKH
jgi:hypothetical protein